jgi:hypothetical protein
MDKLTHVVVTKSFNYDGFSVPTDTVMTVGKDEDLTHSQAVGLLHRGRVRSATDEDIAQASEVEQSEIDSAKKTATKTTKK